MLKLGQKERQEDSRIAMWAMTHAHGTNPFKNLDSFVEVHQYHLMNSFNENADLFGASPIETTRDFEKTFFEKAQKHGFPKSHHTKAQKQLGALFLYMKQVSEVIDLVQKKNKKPAPQQRKKKTFLKQAS